MASLPPYEVLCAISLSGFAIFFLFKRYFALPAKSKSKLASNNERKTSSVIEWNELLENTKKVWTKELSKLPVAIDLPRLAKSMIIEDDNLRSHKKLKKKNQAHTETAEETVKQTLETLAKCLESEPLRNALQSKYYSYVSRKHTEHSGEISREIQNLLKDVVGEDSRTAKVLKACNQSIIAPLVMQLRLNVCAQVPFKDGGGWSIQISVHKDKVFIEHTKRQKQLKTDGGKEEFEFEWKFGMRFLPDMSELKEVTFKITDIKFTETATSKTKQTLQHTLKNYIALNSKQD